MNQPAHQNGRPASRAPRSPRLEATLASGRSPARAFLVLGFAALIAGSAGLRGALASRPASAGEAEPARAQDPSSTAPQGALVRGRVVEAGSAAPCAGTRVRSARPGAQLVGQKLGEAVTGADGRFELAGVALGATVLLVELPGRAIAVDGPFELTGAGTERTIELAEAATKGDGRIHGRLLDVAGRGLARETIALWVAHADQRSTLLDNARTWMTTTDGLGAFDLTGLPAGIYHLGWMRELAEIRTRDLWQLVILGNGSVEAIDLAPRGAATLHGQLEARGKLPDVVEIVILESLTPDSPLPRRGRGGFAVNGAFELTGIEAGFYSVGAFPVLPDGTGSSSLISRVEIRAASAAEVSLAVPAPHQETDRKDAKREGR